MQFETALLARVESIEADSRRSVEREERPMLKPSTRDWLTTVRDDLRRHQSLFDNNIYMDCEADECTEALGECLSLIQTVLEESQSNQQRPL